MTQSNEEIIERTELAEREKDSLPYIRNAPTLEERAELYFLNTFGCDYPWTLAEKEAYIAGARSRDERVKELEEDADGSEDIMIEQQAQIAALKSQAANDKATIEALRDVLSWYAAKANYESGFSHDGCAAAVDDDCGERARETLSRLSSQRGGG